MSQFVSPYLRIETLCDPGAHLHVTLIGAYIRVCITYMPEAFSFFSCVGASPRLCIFVLCTSLRPNSPHSTSNLKYVLNVESVVINVVREFTQPL